MKGGSAPCIPPPPSLSVSHGASGPILQHPSLPGKSWLRACVTKLIGGGGGGPKPVLWEITKNYQIIKVRILIIFLVKFLID